MNSTKNRLFLFFFVTDPTIYYSVILKYTSDISGESLSA